jgi:hypothetical protein
MPNLNIDTKRAFFETKAAFEAPGVIPLQHGTIAGTSGSPRAIVGFRRANNTYGYIKSSDHFTVVSEVAMLALDAWKGDTCYRTDLDRTYKLTVEGGASTLANWADIGGSAVSEPADQIVFGTGTGVDSSADYKKGVATVGGLSGPEIVVDSGTYDAGFYTFEYSNDGVTARGVGLRSNIGTEGGTNASLNISTGSEYQSNGATAALIDTFYMIKGKTTSVYGEYYNLKTHFVLGDTILVSDATGVDMAGDKTYNIGGVPHRHDSWYSAIGHHHPWPQIDEIPAYVPTESPGLAPVLVWADVGGDGDHVYEWTNLDSRYSLTIHTHPLGAITKGAAGRIPFGDPTSATGHVTSANLTYDATNGLFVNGRGTISNTMLSILDSVVTDASGYALIRANSSSKSATLGCFGTSGITLFGISMNGASAVYTSGQDLWVGPNLSGNLYLVGNNTKTATLDGSSLILENAISFRIKDGSGVARSFAGWSGTNMSYAQGALLFDSTNLYGRISTRLRVGDSNSPVYAVDVVGDIRCSAGFGCNNKSPQTSYSVNSAASDLNTVISLCNQLRAALVANGICI